MQPIARVDGDPAAPLVHRFRSRRGEHVLVIPYSRLFDIAPDDTTIGRDGDAFDTLVRSLVEPDAGEEPLEHVVAPAPQSVSLNVSSSCNLSCSYCYAARGSFAGAQPDPMPWEVAREAIDALLARADPTRPITIGFMGGEPFVNRALIHQCVEYTVRQGCNRDLDIRFSVTTNGTLLRAEDLALLRTHRFAVTISIDGGAALQDRQRPASGRSRSSFAALKQATTPLLADPGQAQIAARATVTRDHLDLPQHFDDIIALGFPEVGFSPLRVDRNGRALRDEDWPRYLEALQRVALAELARGGPIRLTNLAVALKQIARGASSPYPCGAGGGYFSVSSAGKWYACHRAIGVDEFAMGDNVGLDEARRRDFLKARHVHAQAACRRCWARYLCSGACHQEASARSDSACGFVRGWLEFCLSIYCELAPHPTGARIFSARELWS